MTCGDNAAAINPGPNSSTIQIPRYITRIRDEWERNREYNEERDRVLYGEFKRKTTINRKESEIGIRMKEEEFIEQNIEWKEEIRGNNVSYTFTRKKNERKNQILENWRRIREEEDSEDRFWRSEDRWKGRKKRARSSDGERNKKKDNIIINNRYKVLEGMEEEVEKDKRECE